jgi:hypothetical protein
VIIVLLAIGGLVYFGYTHPEYPARIIAYFKNEVEGTISKPFTPLGTKENPYDWSTPEKQIAIRTKPSKRRYNNLCKGFILGLKPIRIKNEGVV